MQIPDMRAAERCACGCDACEAVVPAGLDLARARDTELGLYRVELTDLPASADGRAGLSVLVTPRLRAEPADAEVTISGGRPRCRCAAPASLAITRRGPGAFETAPFSFPSPGWWVIRVSVAGDAGWDAVTFNLAIGVTD
jgi:hypothetical protein